MPPPCSPALLAHRLHAACCPRWCVAAVDALQQGMLYSAQSVPQGTALHGIRAVCRWFKMLSGWAGHVSLGIASSRDGGQNPPARNATGSLLVHSLI